MPEVAPAPAHAVVFDLDGVLVDSEHLWAQAERDVVAAFDVPWSPAIQRELLGRGPADAARRLAARLGVDDAAEVERRMLAAAIARFERGVPARPGAARLLAALRGRVPLAVATNSRRVLAELALASAGFADALDALVSADDVDAPKPAPDPYATACRLLGVEPARAVAIEDSPVGVISARAAGLWVLGCPSLPGTVLEGAHHVVGSLDEVDPAGLLAA